MTEEKFFEKLSEIKLSFGLYKNSIAECEERIEGVANFFKTEDDINWHASVIFTPITAVYWNEKKKYIHWLRKEPAVWGLQLPEDFAKELMSAEWGNCLANNYLKYRKILMEILKPSHRKHHG